MLGEHFLTEEEEDGLFDVVDGRTPQCHSQLEKLRKDHRSLSDELEELRQRARACDEHEQPLVHEDFLAFATHLAAHEERETRLFLDSWCTDLGEMD